MGSEEPAPDLLMQELSDNLVQVISERGDDVPDRFIHKDGFPQAADATDELWRDTLLIDFSLLSSSDPAELAKLKSALSNWGCFQMINHGIERSLLEELIEVGKKFFALPLEEKLKWSTGDKKVMQGYGGDYAFAFNKTVSWHDRLFLTLYPQESRMPEFWPQKPHNFSETLNDYAKKVAVMTNAIYKAMAKSLNLDKKCFLNQVGQEPERVKLGARFILYPRCSLPDRVLGVGPHFDSASIAVILPELEGLQIMKDDQWFKVPVIPGALFVNLGQLSEIMSNGTFKATVHRVMTNSTMDRLSVVAFSTAVTTDKEIGPISELIRDDEPQKYNKFSNFSEYMQSYREYLRNTAYHN